MSFERSKCRSSRQCLQASSRVRIFRFIIKCIFFVLFRRMSPISRSGRVPFNRCSEKLRRVNKKTPGKRVIFFTVQVHCNLTKKCFPLQVFFFDTFFFELFQNRFHTEDFLVTASTSRLILQVSQILYH